MGTHIRSETNWHCVLTGVQLNAVVGHKSWGMQMCVSYLYRYPRNIDNKTRFPTNRIDCDLEEFGEFPLGTKIESFPRSGLARYLNLRRSSLIDLYFDCG